MESEINGSSSDEATHQSLNEHIKLATEPILQQAKRFCTFLADQSGLYTAGNRDVISSRRENTSTSSADNR